MADFTGQQFRINPVGPRQQSPVIAGTPEATAMTPPTDLGIDMTGLQDIENLTSEVYSAWGDLQSFAAEMNSLGIDVTRPNPMIPESYEASKVFYTMAATLRNQVNALKQGQKGLESAQQAQMYGRGRIDSEFSGSQAYGGDVFENMARVGLEPEVESYNKAVQTAMDRGSDVTAFIGERDEIERQLRAKLAQAQTRDQAEYWQTQIDSLMRPKQRIIFPPKYANDPTGGAEWLQQAEGWVNIWEEIVTNPNALVPEANTGKIKEVMSDNKSGMLMARVNEGTDSNPKWRVKFIERTPENGFGVRELYNIHMEGRQTSERKNFDKLANDWDQNTFMELTAIRDNDDNIIGYTTDPSSRNIEESEKNRTERKDYAYKITDALMEHRMTEDNPYKDLLKTSAKRMALPPGIDERHTGKYIESIESSRNVLGSNKINIKLSDSTSVDIALDETFLAGDADVDKQSKLYKLIYYNLPAINFDGTQPSTSQNTPLLNTEDAMTNPVPTISPTDTVSEAAKRIGNWGIGGN